MWFKVDKGTRGGGKKARTGFAVSRGKTGPAYIVIPSGIATAAKANLMTDGRGRLAIKFANDGAFAVIKANGGTLCRRICLPVAFRDMVPVGTTDVGHEVEGDLFIINLNGLTKLSAAA